MPQGEGLWEPWLANTSPLSHAPQPPAPLPTPSTPKAPPAMPRWGSTTETLAEIWTRIHWFWGSALHTGLCAVLVEHESFAARGKNHFALHPPLHLVSQEAAGFSLWSSSWNWWWRRRWGSWGVLGKPWGPNARTQTQDLSCPKCPVNTRRVTSRTLSCATTYLLTRRIWSQGEFWLQGETSQAVPALTPITSALSSHSIQIYQNKTLQG